MNLARSAPVGLALALACGATSSADVVHLKTGGRLEGVIVEENADRVTVDVPVGRVSVSRNSVRRIERAESALAEYRARIRSLRGAGTADEWVQIALFASQSKLRTQAREAWREVLRRNPSNELANLELGRVFLAGAWLDENEANRARGLVQQDGRWITPAEQDSILRERERSAEAERREREARQAARDAEGRAIRAEAERDRARRAAEANTRLYGYGHGGPFYGGGGYFGSGSSCLALPCGGAQPIWQQPAPVPAPTVAPYKPPTPKGIW
jgi:hypothetical protein